MTAEQYSFEDFDPCDYSLNSKVNSGPRQHLHQRFDITNGNRRHTGKPPSRTSSCQSLNVKLSNLKEFSRHPQNHFQSSLNSFSSYENITNATCFRQHGLKLAAIHTQTYNDGIIHVPNTTQNVSQLPPKYPRKREECNHRHERRKSLPAEKPKQSRIAEDKLPDSSSDNGYYKLCDAVSSRNAFNGIGSKTRNAQKEKRLSEVDSLYSRISDIDWEDTQRSNDVLSHRLSPNTVPDIISGISSVFQFNSKKDNMTPFGTSSNHNTNSNIKSNDYSGQISNDGSKSVRFSYKDNDNKLSNTNTESPTSIFLIDKPQVRDAIHQPTIVLRNSSVSSSDESNHYENLDDESENIYSIYETITPRILGEVEETEEEEEGEKEEVDKDCEKDEDDGYVDIASVVSDYADMRSATTRINGQLLEEEDESGYLIPTTRAPNLDALKDDFDSVDNIVMGCNKKELQRANTLPLIDIPSILASDDPAKQDSKVAPKSGNNTSSPVTSNRAATSLAPAASTSGKPPSSSTNTSPVNRWVRRKLSCQEFIMGRRSDNDESKTKTRMLGVLRSQSADRRCEVDTAKIGSAWGFDDDRPPHQVDSNRSTTQLFYTTPPRANMARSSSSERRLESSSSAGNLQKISRKLVVRDKKDLLGSARIRSISVDCGDGRQLKKRSSYSEAEESRRVEMMSYIPTSPSAPAYLGMKDGVGAGGAGGHGALTLGQHGTQVARDIRGLTLSQKKKSVSIDVAESYVGNKRKTDKEKKGFCDLSSLFDAVEQQDLDKVKAILDTCHVDVNGLNSENLTVLDVAVMTNNIPIAKVLLSKGGKESPLFQRGDCRVQRLESLVSDAERRVVDLTASVLNGSAGNANISPAQQKDNEKQLSHWEFRHRLLKRMKAGYDHARPPEPPTQVRLHVASDTSLLVTFDETQRHNGAVVTRYKVEWSSYENFMPISEEAIVEDLSRLQFEICNICNGHSYYVRVYAWNVKGYSPCAYSTPPCAIPSSWREVDSVPSRLEGKMSRLHALFQQVQRSRPPEVSDLKDMFYRGKDSPVQQKKRVSIKNLFVSTPKFQKTIKRGVHMACLLYSDDRVLVASEEQLPIVEVDETFSGLNVQNDLYWLLKVSCMWEDVKVLKHDMEKTSSASSTLRCKLLQAISSLQTALGIQDLGQIFHRPIRDSNGSIIFVLINHIRDTKSVTLSSGKWVTLGKLARRQSLSSMDIGDAQSLLINAMPEMVLYNQVHGKALSKGLYVGYVKLQTSLDVLRVMVPNRMPSCIPHVKIKDCPNVSKEEWEWLRQCEMGSVESSAMTTEQLQFQRLLSDASKKLFHQLGLPDSSFSTHRIYDLEVMELSPDVSMILILPSIEDICIVPGRSDTLSERVDYTFLPVQVFESIHMNAYLPDFFDLYAKLSAIVEMDGVLAQQGHREAFSSEEISKTKEQVEVTSHLQTSLDRVWKCARWIRDITTYARNKERKSGIEMLQLISISTSVSSTDPAIKTRLNNNNHNINNNNNDNNNDTVFINTSPSTRGSYRLNLNGSNNSSNDNNFTSPNPHNKLSRAVGGGSSIGTGLPNPKTGKVVRERRIAKFFDPTNEENPHSTDSISVGRSFVRQTSSGSDSSLSIQQQQQQQHQQQQEQPHQEHLLQQPYQHAKSLPVSPVTPSQIGTTHISNRGRISSSSSLSSLSTVASSSSSSSSSNNTNIPSGHDPNWGIIKVHAMYETGLSKNVNMKLHITEQTSSRDIINLVVRHLNSLALEKSRNMIVYSEESLSEFCVILQYQGQRSVLSDDFKLLQLKGHLKKARVCVTRLDKESTTTTVGRKEMTRQEVDEEEDDDLLQGRATLV